MKIKTLKISNFKSYSECFIDFEQLDGLYQISGVVGSGKTTIGEAILWGLFGNLKGKTNPELVKWGEKNMTVELILESKGRSIRILRGAGKKSILDVFKDDTQLIAPNKTELQRMLENELYDCSRMAVETLCLISFDSFKSISSFGTGAKRDFLDTIFGFSLLSDYIDIINDEVKDSRKAISELERSLSGVEGEIRGTQRTIPTEGECTEEEWLQLKENIKQIDSELKQMRSDRDTELAQYRKRILEDEREMSVYVADGKRLKGDIAYLERGICPTCGAKLDTSMLETYKSNLESIRENWKILNNHKGEIETEMKARQMELDALISDKNGNFSDLTYKLSRMNVWRESQKTIRKDIEGLTKKQTELTDTLRESKNDLDDWSSLKTELDSTIRRKLLANLIPNLNDILLVRASQLGFPYQIEFDDEFNCLIRDTNNFEISVASLSTGQKKLADMSIILSVLDLLMKGINFNIQFFDELLSNMDEDLRDRVCQCLKDSSDKSYVIFLISHAKLPEGLLDGTIEIENRNGTSNLRLI